MFPTPQAAVCIARDFAVKREEFSHMWHGRTDPLRGEELYSIVMQRNRSLAARQFTRQEFDKVLPHAAHQTNSPRTCTLAEIIGAPSPPWPHRPMSTA